MASNSLAKLTTVANFPEHYMLENLAVRSDGSILVVASPQRQVWYVPTASESLPVEPILLHTFDNGHLAQCFVEALPDIFYVATYGRATLHRFDLRNWTPGSPVSPTRVLGFEPPAGPNGGCLIAPGVMLFSDCVEGLIWRVDLSDDGLHATARVWLKHDTMAAGAGKPPVRFSATMEVPFPCAIPVEPISGLAGQRRVHCQLSHHGRIVLLEHHQPLILQCPHVNALVDRYLRRAVA